MNQTNLTDTTQPIPQRQPEKIINIRAFFPSWTTLFILVVFFLALTLNGGVDPFVKRGFFCNDSTINYPLKTDTVGIVLLLFVAIVIPSIVIKFCDTSLCRLSSKIPDQGKSILLGSRFYHRKRRKLSDNILEVDAEEEELISSTTVNPKVKRRQLFVDEVDYKPITRSNSNGLLSFDNEISCDENMTDHSDEDGEVNLFSTIPLDSDNDDNNIPDINSNRRLSLVLAHIYLHRTFNECNLYLFGLVTTMFLTGIGKITGGRLRPHFMQVCQPNVDCTLSSNRNRYIEEFVCQGDLSKMRPYSYITTSWPSGHASVIFYSMIYLMVYMQTTIPILVQTGSDNIKRRYNPLMFFSIYVVMMGFALYVSMTRVTDYHHHPTDVLSGCILGVIIALAMSKFSLSKQYSDMIIQNN